LALPDPYFVLPVLVVVTAWFQQKLISASSPSTGGGEVDDQAQAMTQSMQITMPLFMGFISLNYASGLSVYFVISNIIGILQYYFIQRRYNLESESE
jgi:YidC/Oxa1 family membrane protein insertase